VAYVVGDWALLRLRHRAAASMPRASSGKLKARFLGSYRVTEVINAVAVRLELPPQARLHDLFHVGTLKKFVGTPPASPPLLPDIKHGAVVPALERVTQARLARGVRQVLVFWRGEPPSSATWEDHDNFRATYPDFQLEDELTLQGGEMSCGASRTSDPGATATSTELRNALRAHKRKRSKRDSKLVARKY